MFLFCFIYFVFPTGEKKLKPSKKKKIYLHIVVLLVFL